MEKKKKFKLKYIKFGAFKNPYWVLQKKVANLSIKINNKFIIFLKLFGGCP